MNQAYFYKKEQATLDIFDVALLSTDEIKKYKDNLPLSCEWFWLRCPGGCGPYGAYFSLSGIREIRCCPENCRFAVCPVLHISNLKALSIQEGDILDFKSHKWTVISENLAICNDNIGYSYYDEETLANYIDDWIEEHHIVLSKKREEYSCH